MRRAAIFLATGAYTGLFPIAPGTAGSFAAAIVLFFLPSFSSPAYFIALIFLFVIGVWAATEGEKHYKRADASQVVIDEIVGMMVSLALLPTTMNSILLAFFLFRLFDIIKPFPVRQAERVDRLIGRWGHRSPVLLYTAGGLAIMLDDVLAGVYANIATRWILTLM